jgi:hypothetical protein
MVALSITSLVSFFDNEQKSLTRGENHYKFSHVESFTYADGTIRGEVHARMREKVYKVTVSYVLDGSSAIFKLSNSILLDDTT